MTRSKGSARGMVPVVIIGLLALGGLCAAGPLLGSTLFGLLDMANWSNSVFAILCCSLLLVFGFLVFVFIKFIHPRLQDENSNIKTIFKVIGLVLWFILPPLILYAVVYEQIIKGMMALGKDTLGYVIGLGLVLFLIWIPVVFMLGMALYMRVPMRSAK